MKDDKTQETQFLESIQSFYDLGSGGLNARRTCKTQGYRELFMPEIAGLFLPTVDQSDESFQRFILNHSPITSPSIEVAGRTKQGNVVVVYAHMPVSFTDLDHLEGLKKKGVRGCISVTDKEFQDLISADGKTDEVGNRLVWVDDYDKLRKAKTGCMTVTDILDQDHPRIVPFFGGKLQAEFLRKWAAHRGLSEIVLKEWLSVTDKVFSESPSAYFLSLQEVFTDLRPPELQKVPGPINPDQYKLSAELYYLGICGSANIFGIKETTIPGSTQAS